MPEATDYRPMHGRSKGHDLTDGTHTRVKIDLFPEYIRNLPPEKRALWDVVGRALCSAAGQAGLHPPPGARPVEALRRRLRQGRHVSDPDPDPRHPRLSDHAAHRHQVEGDHGAALSAEGRRQHRHRHHLPRAAARRLDAEEGADALCAEHRLRVRGGDGHLALGGPGARSRQVARTRSCSPISSTRACCATSATAASGSAISCSTRSGNTCRSDERAPH